MDRHTIARGIARNSKTAADPVAYMNRKRRQHGPAVIILAERYIAAIAAAERANPGRCRAHIDDEAERMITGEV